MLWQTKNIIKFLGTKSIPGKLYITARKSLMMSDGTTLTETISFWNKPDRLYTNNKYIVLCSH